MRISALVGVHRLKNAYFQLTRENVVHATAELLSRVRSADPEYGGHIS